MKLFILVLTYALLSSRLAQADSILFSSAQYRAQIEKMPKTKLAWEVTKRLSGYAGQCIKGEVNSGLTVIWNGYKLKSPNLNNEMKVCFEELGKYIDATNYLFYGTFEPSFKSTSEKQDKLKNIDSDRSKAGGFGGTR